MFQDNGSNWQKWDLHVHTASSFDYGYKATDCNEELVKAWDEHSFAAVAITDHFLIDAKRIKELREMVKDQITVFPGVELRTDKGSSNIHVILIFNEECDLNTLASDFESRMLRSKAKPKNYNDENVYWDYADILEFAGEYDAIISIHSGNKSNGIDKCMVNALPQNMAIKTEYSETVNIYEVSRIEDIKGYKENVFKNIIERPVIICSDNHDPRNYTTRENLWIKALPTFSGLKQAIIHPQERVFIGETPHKISNFQRNPEKYIESITVEKNKKAVNHDHWFNFEIDLNIGLTTVIGNKGSGKSAFADLLGYVGKSENTDKFSFLSKTRFAKEDKQFNNDYKGTIKWADGERNSVERFNLDDAEEGISLVRYLPQRYIEETCNDLDKSFQEEIDKVIFSYVDNENKGSALCLNELVKQQQISIKERIDYIKMNISSTNEQIINLEGKRNVNYTKRIEEGRKHFENELSRHDANKPKEINLPDVNDKTNKEGLDFISSMNLKIVDIEEEITYTQHSLANEKACQTELVDYKIKLENEHTRIKELGVQGEELTEKFKLNPQIHINIDQDLSGLNKRIKDARENIDNYSKLLSQNIKSYEYTSDTQPSSIEHDYNQTSSLIEKKQILEARINRAKELLGRPQKLYQKFLDDLKKWEVKRKEIIGDDSTIESLSFYKKEADYLKYHHSLELKQLKEKRQHLISELFDEIIKKKEVLNDIYKPVEKKLDSILESIKDKVVFKVSIYTDTDFVQNTLMYINQSVQSDFRGKTEGVEYINSLIRRFDFSSFVGVLGFVESILDATTGDEDKINSLIRKRLEFYNHITCLDYFNVGFSLKMGDKELEQLSPGEKGTVLLVFYLALDKEEKPLIIDQPEDNLDNQSVFDKLVPCVIEAKKNRQVVLITHNPNLAIACDSELIIYSENFGNEIKYQSGPIEDKVIRRKLIDILEGTMPAFDLRTNKYKDHLFIK